MDVQIAWNSFVDWVDAHIQWGSVGQWVSGIVASVAIWMTVRLSWATRNQVEEGRKREYRLQAARLEIHYRGTTPSGGDDQMNVNYEIINNSERTVRNLILRLGNVDDRPANFDLADSTTELSWPYLHPRDPSGSSTDRGHVWQTNFNLIVTSPFDLTELMERELLRPYLLFSDAADDRWKLDHDHRLTDVSE